MEVLNVWPVTRTRPGDPNDANHGQDVVGGLSGWLVKSSWTGLRPWTAVSRYPPQASWVQQTWASLDEECHRQQPDVS